ncbi:MAG: DUF4212 domain-containing protein [Phycisphaerales bacterium]|nr:DUF4212 domain-containing protein [Phycisphaerales bacterium]
MSEPDPRIAAAKSRYWRSNLRIVVVLLVAWAAVGLGCGVLFVEYLNQWPLGGFPLGFWFAHQGSVITFVVLILIYALWMGRLDARLRKDLAATEAGR